MQITIDTENLTTRDRQILDVLLGQSSATPAPEPEAKPAKKAAAKKPEPEPEPEPEPMAEEELPEEDEPANAPDDETSDEDLLDLAVKKATSMVASGEAAKVREALDAAGASRVRELNVDNVRDFFKALS